jgi:ankyrin repeat protein
LEVVHCIDVNQTSDQGYTPLCFATQKGRIDIVRCLDEEFGTDVNKATNAGATTVLLAVQDGRLDILRLLLKSGADIDRPDFEA